MTAVGCIMYFSQCLHLQVDLLVKCSPDGGDMQKYIYDLKPGEVMEMRGPMVRVDNDICRTCVCSQTIRFRDRFVCMGTYVSATVEYGIYE